MVLLVRPDLDIFLSSLEPLFEFVIWTTLPREVASTQQIADPIIDQIDDCDIFRRRLFSEHCQKAVIGGPADPGQLENNFLTKNLKSLGCKLSSIISLEVRVAHPGQPFALPQVPGEHFAPAVV